jgi:tetratricopeptide (TPR) repeat protein
VRAVKSSRNQNSRRKKGVDAKLEADIESALHLESPSHSAMSLFVLGQLMENERRYAAAARCYAQALQFETDDEWTYFMNNNLGFSLNQVGRFKDAEGYCRAATRIDPLRHNAWKNLGVAFTGQGLFPEAAAAFITAVRACPRDGRALGHLDELMAAHGDVVARVKPGARAALRKFLDGEDYAFKPREETGEASGLPKRPKRSRKPRRAER